MNSRSIRFRLTASYTAVLAATFAGAVLLFLIVLRHSVTKTVDKELHARFTIVGTYVQEEASGEGIKHLREELNEDAVVNAGSAYLRIADAANYWIYRSPNTKNWSVPLPASHDLPSGGLIETVLVSGKPMRLLTGPVAVGVAQIGLPLDEFREMERNLLWTIALGMPLLLIVASAAGYWLSGRALQPVDRIATSAQRITSENLSQRLPYSGTGDELDRLSAVLNQMLAGLESAFRRVTQFTADASHELRTPLAIVRSTAELMRSRARNPEEQEKAWASVLRQTERTSQLVDDLLTLTRADAGSSGLDFEASALPAILEMAKSDMEILAESKGIQLRLKTHQQALLYGDGEALRRVFTILLDNAVKASRSGSAIDICLLLEGEPSARLAVVSIQDWGIGIPPDDLPYIFDRFYRVSKDRSRETGGAGLGLAIANWIVTQHGGTIRAESKLGQGSIFRVILPVASGPIAPSEILQNQSAT